MILTGRRIRSIARRLGPIAEGQRIMIGLNELDRFDDKLRCIGFTPESADGDTLLPPVLFGPVSRYNAEGRDIVHRDQPMETAYRQVEWHWKEFHGPYDRVERSDIVDVPYQRYPRTFDPPPSVEMTITSDAKGNRLVVTPELVFEPANHSRIKHAVNLFLEIFGECNVMDRNLQSVYHAPVRRLHWRVLPEGRMPWASLSRALDPIVQRQPDGNQPVIRHRLQAVNAHKPEFVAVGQGGFDGYVIFAFPDLNMYILECVHYGNATYVFNDDWERLSQMTKAEILDNSLQQDRLIHRENWRQHLDALFR